MATSPDYAADEAYRQHENLSTGTIQSSLARWTDEQEIALLKGIVRWKPVGSSISVFGTAFRPRN